MSDLRRKSILNATKQQQRVAPSPLRKSARLESTPFLDISNDDLERQNRRSKAELEKRISNIPSLDKDQTSTPTKPNKSLGEQFNLSNFNTNLSNCNRLFTENKISTKNVWELHIIKILSQLAQSRDEPNIQITSNTLDICAKVYGIRVDSVYTTGLQLANNWHDSNQGDGAMDTDDANNSHVDADTKQKKTQRRKRIRRPGVKPTIDSTGNAIFSELEPIENEFFMRNEKITDGNVDKLFTSFMPLHPEGMMFRTLGKEVYWINDAKVVDQNDYEKIAPFFTLPNVNSYTIANAFNEFVLSDWRPEDFLDSTETNVMNEIHNDLVVDENGVPVHELDGSMHDIFHNNNAHDDTNLDDHNNNDGSDLEINEFRVPHLINKTTHGNIVGVIPEEIRDENEFGYYRHKIGGGSGDQQEGLNLEKMWAGPSHWKVNFIKQVPYRYTGAEEDGSNIEEGGKRKKRKLREPDVKFDFSQFIDNIDRTLIQNKKKKPTVNDKSKILLPMPLIFEKNELELTYLLDSNKKFMIRNVSANGGVEPNTNLNNDDNDDIDVYDYGNANDSSYLPSNQNQNENGDHDGGVEGTAPNEIVGYDVENFNDTFSTGDMLGGLIEAPQMVTTTRMIFSHRPKNVDMKVLKKAAWNYIMRDKNAPPMSTTTTPASIGDHTQFSKLYKALKSNMLSGNNRQDLSPQIAFTAILYLCNEQSLCLEKLKDGDFSIINSS